MKMVTPLLLVSCLALPAAHAATRVVNVQDNSFSPSNLTICLGDTVRWDWVGSMDHTVTSGDGCGAPNGAFASALQSTGSFSYTFSTIPPQCATDESAGDNTCSYFCIPHCSSMDGVITVTDAPGAGLGLSRNKLRITSDPTEGRGGTTLGVEMLDGARFDQVVAGTTDVTMTLTGPGLMMPISSTVTLSDSRGNFSGRFPQDTGNQLDIRSASIRVTDADLAKVTLKWETNGFDLNAAGPLTLMVTISHDINGVCGPAPIQATSSRPVSH